MKIYIASDHAGFELKEALIPFLRELGHEAKDFGAYEYDELDDYPDFIAPAVQAVIKEEETDEFKEKEARAIILGGSGQGEAMCANRFLGVRAAVYYGGPKEILTLSREHNDANVLSLGARFLSEEEMKDAVEAWLETSFSGEARHKRRNEKLD